MFFFLIYLFAKHTRISRCLLSDYLSRFLQHSFRPLFPLFIHYIVRRFVPVTLVEWCQLHKDFCRAQKYRRGCWRGRLIYSGGDKSRKGEREDPRRASKKDHTC